MQAFKLGSKLFDHHNKLKTAIKSIVAFTLRLDDCAGLINGNLLKFTKKDIVFLKVTYDFEIQKQLNAMTKSWLRECLMILGVNFIASMGVIHPKNSCRKYSLRHLVLDWLLIR